MIYEKEFLKKKIHMSQEICVRLKDGKIRIAHKGKPFFPEPLHKDVLIIQSQEDLLLVGPYPKENTMIMPLDQYHKILMELKNNCPDAKSWKRTAFIFLGMFLTMVGLYLHQLVFRDMIRRWWNENSS